MPIRPENAARYGEAWDALALTLKFCADYRCECDGRCGRPADHLGADGRCRNHHGQPAHGTGSRVVLTIAHLDHTPENNDRENLMVACQGCHLHYDPRPPRSDSRREARAFGPADARIGIGKRSRRPPSEA